MPRKARRSDQLSPLTNKHSDRHHNSAVSVLTTKPLRTPTAPAWLTGVHYLSGPISSPYLTERQKKWLYCKPAVSPSEPSGYSDNKDAIPIIKIPLTRDEIDSHITVNLINDETHPANGQRGLFASRDLAPGELVIPYIGYVHSSTVSEQVQAQQQALNDVKQQCCMALRTDADRENHADGTVLLDSSHEATIQTGTVMSVSNLPQRQVIGSWDTSSYDLNLHRDEDVELAIDAAQMGNEARFCNDYRGVPAQPSTTEPKDSFSRSSKRAAKSWHKRAKDDVTEDEWAASQLEIAIPNAEFRDVWFEWAVADESEPGTEEQEEVLGSTRTKLENVTVEGSCASEVAAHKADDKKMRRQRRRRSAGMRGVAIFVLPAGRSGKRKYGIKAGHEVLVSYGKGFWAHHAIEA